MYFNVHIVYFNVFTYIVIGILPSHSHYNVFVMHTYNDKQNRVLLVIAFIQKAIAYSCVNKIQICKHGSCSIQYIETCEKKIELKIN
jgi:hypothetical protein